MYPLGGLACAACATKLAVRAKDTVALHSAALVLTAVATLLFAGCDVLQRLLSRAHAGVTLAALRSFQGAANAFYLAANTSLITRRFPHAVPYVVGMFEVST